jgi:hypothetical protein
MIKKTFVPPAAALLVFLALWCTACEEEEDWVVPSKRVVITDIPASYSGYKSNPITPFRIYIQLSTGMDASAGHVAQGCANLTGGQTSATMTLYNKPGSLDPTSTAGGAGAFHRWYNVAVTITPQDLETASASNNATTPEKALNNLYLRAGQVRFDAETKTFSLMSLPFDMKASMPQQVRQMYGKTGVSGIITNDSGITTPSGNLPDLNSTAAINPNAD